MYIYIHTCIHIIPDIHPWIHISWRHQERYRVQEWALSCRCLRAMCCWGLQMPVRAMSRDWVSRGWAGSGSFERPFPKQQWGGFGQLPKPMFLKIVCLWNVEVLLCSLFSKVGLLFWEVVPRMPQKIEFFCAFEFWQRGGLCRLNARSRMLSDHCDAKATKIELTWA